jgi:hypothetical protein
LPWDTWPSTLTRSIMVLRRGRRSSYCIRGRTICGRLGLRVSHQRLWLCRRLETGAADDDKDAGPDGGKGADALTSAGQEPVVGDAGERRSGRRMTWRQS